MEAEGDQRGALAEQARGGAHADQGVVFAVLQGVDRVIGDRPQGEAEIEQVDRAGDQAGGGRADQDAPVEGEAEPGLRPPGDALGEGIDGDQRQGEQGGDLRVPGQEQPDDEARAELGGEEEVSVAQRDRAGRDRAGDRAGDFRVEVAVCDVVPGAAGAAHDDGADEEQEDPAEIDQEQAAGEALEGEADEAGQEQQPDADGPVEPRQHGIGAPGRRQA